ncbi:hypothetical protein WSS_A37744 [Rhodococcus opacus M213]|uniref:AAA+ ATPase domain-containing protein n=1 Tax=Rhodococcus opacus M213 TaxID=1129896 RepID=K8X997_RHOOP|nr:AAA family ATPase [Rhodococcus opacus]EKT77401.1 hypothetical protein WSS_A37744 [Rhodococcus opacus M213]
MIPDGDDFSILQATEKDDVRRALSAAIDEDRAEAAREKETAVEDYLANRRAIVADSVDELHDFLDVLNLDVDEESPVELFVDEDGSEYKCIERPSDRLLNHAYAEGLVWSGIDADGERFGAHMLFVVLDETTAELFTKSHRAEFPGVKAFPACPGLGLAELSDRFHAAGLNIDDYAPPGEGITLTAEMFEHLTDPDTWDIAEPETADDELESADDDAMADVDEEEAQKSSRPGIFDHRTARSQPLPPRVWLENGIIEAECVNKVTAASGSGKTLLLAHLAVNWSLGRSALDVDENGQPRELDRPQRVLYIDGELGPRQWHRILDKLGAPLDLPNFHLRTLTDDAPTWPALCTPEGAAQFLTWIDSGEEVDVIVLDTLSAFVGGEESSNDTWLEFDRLVTLPLKSAGFTVIYADHTGHEARRARGGSAKKAKLDVEWVLDVPDSRAPNTLRMTSDPTAGKMRNGHDGYPMTVYLDRVDGPLGHVRVEKDDAADELRDTLSDPRRAILIGHMDRLGLPMDVSKRAAQEALRAANIKFDDKVLLDAKRTRVNRESARLAAEESLANGGEIDAQE